MPPTYTEHETVSLKNHADFNEGWLQNIIAENPAILGLGELGFIPKERRQESGGRLDLLLSDENDVRYEVELQLGATDEQHLFILPYLSSPRTRRSMPLRCCYPK